MKSRMIVCSFSATEYPSRKKLTYDRIKKAVLREGGFTIFEATTGPKAIALFSQLQSDKSLIVERAGYPWYSVRRKAASGSGEGEP